jgi:hypothetical protein
MYRARQELTEHELILASHECRQSAEQSESNHRDHHQVASAKAVCEEQEEKGSPYAQTNDGVDEPPFGNFDIEAAA